MKHFLLFSLVAFSFLGCKKKGTDDPNPILPEGDFEIEVTVSGNNKLLVAWSNPENLSGNLSYVVYLGDEKLGETTENYFTTDIAGNRFVNGRVTATDTNGNTETHVFLAEGGSRDLVYIPDPVFEQELINWKIISDSLVDGKVELVKVLEVTKVSFPNANIQSHVGIEAFRNLEFFLTTEGGLIKELDVRQNLKLKELQCHWNGIIKLYLNKNLEVLSLFNSRLIDKLDVSKNLNLKGLSCIGTNNLKILDLGRNIKWLSLSGTQLEYLDLYEIENLESFDCRYKNPKLKTICVADVEKAKANEYWKKDATAEYVQCE